METMDVTTTNTITQASDKEIQQSLQQSIPQIAPLDPHQCIQIINFVKPSFENIDPRTLPFKFAFRCALSTAGQVVQGLAHTGRYLSGSGEYSENFKPITNKFQEFLYPKISEIANLIVNNYVANFVENITDPLIKEVYGSNLNGSGNDGQLPNAITCTGVSRNVKYEHIQFKNAIALLNYRLNFIAKRDPQTIKRYRNSKQECLLFETLQIKAREFCNYLEQIIYIKWDEVKTEARKFNDDVAIKNETSMVKFTINNSKKIAKSINSPIFSQLTKG